MNYDSKLLPAKPAAKTPSRSDADIDAFLAQGGKVTALEANRRVDLPKPPKNNYGKGSI